MTIGLLQEVPHRTTMRVVDSSQSSGEAECEKARNAMVDRNIVRSTKNENSKT